VISTGNDADLLDLCKQVHLGFAFIEQPGEMNKMPCAAA